MDIITKEEFLLHEESNIEKFDEGIVFIHPTDTIYGLGADATNNKAVVKIKDIKKRQDRPFSVIAPSKQWIFENCYVSDAALKWIEKLPGPYTFILKLKNRDCISKEVNNGAETLGVRIPDHWISKTVNKYKKPIISTSANITGESYMTDIEDLPSEIKDKVSFAIYEGDKQARPSTLVDLTKENIQVVER